jgi:hypothetical protein
MYQARNTSSREGQVIHIQPLAPPKPPPATRCNGCGVCCLAAPCPLGILLSRRRDGACVALRWEPGASRYLCGAVAQPAAVLGSALPARLKFLAHPLSTVLARWARRWIAAGQGCDSTLQVQGGADIIDNEAKPKQDTHD